jgi:hypothetical protein
MTKPYHILTQRATPPLSTPPDCRCQPCTSWRNFHAKKFQNERRKVIAFASRALNPVEQRYSQTEREALAILWACEHFHLYVYGSHFTVITDHKPLEQIHANPRSRCSARLERWSLKLQRYDFTVKYQPGKSNAADYMSNHPLPSSPSNQYSKIADEYISFVAQHATPKAISLDYVKTATVNDPTLQHLTKAIRTGNWTVTPIQRNSGVDPQEMNAYFKLYIFKMYIFSLTKLFNLQNSLIIHEENTKKNHKRVVSVYAEPCHLGGGGLV